MLITNDQLMVLATEVAENQCDTIQGALATILQNTNIVFYPNGKRCGVLKRDSYLYDPVEHLQGSTITWDYKYGNDKWVLASVFLNVPMMVDVLFSSTLMGWAPEFCHNGGIRTMVVPVPGSTMSVMQGNESFIPKIDLEAVNRLMRGNIHKDPTLAEYQAVLRNSAAMAQEAMGGITGLLSQTFFR